MKNKNKLLIKVMIIILILISSLEFFMLNYLTNFSRLKLQDSSIFIKNNEMDMNKIWEKKWGGLEYDKSYDVVGIGNNIYLVGETKSFGNGETDVFIVKYHSNGTIIWNITWGGTDWDGARGVFADKNGIYVTGYTKSFGNGSENLFVLKASNNGTIIWNITWGNLADDSGTDIIVDNDYIYVVGITNSYGAGGSDAVFLKLNQSGSIEWNYTWGGIGNDYGYGIANQSGFIYISGATSSFGNGNSDSFLAKFYDNGTQIWNKTWGGIYEDLGGRICVGGGPIFVTGETRSFGAGSSDIFLLKFSPGGDLVWNYTWGGTGNDFGSRVIWTETKIYVIGMYENPSTNSDDAVLLKFYDNGTIIWNYTWGTSNTEWGFGICTLNSKIYISGFIRIGGGDNYDAFLIKLGIELIPPELKQIQPPITINPNVLLSWNKIFAATSYKIYRSNQSISNITGLQYIKETTNTYWTDVLKNYGTYYYVVVASNGTHDSSISNCINVSYISRISGPHLILLTNSLAFDSFVNLSWTKINNSLYYRIYRTPYPITSIEGIIPIEITVDNHFNDTLPYFGVFFYSIVATTEYMNSTLSNSVIVIYFFTNDSFKFFLEYIIVGLIVLISSLSWYYINKRKYTKQKFRTKDWEKSPS